MIKDLLKGNARHIYAILIAIVVSSLYFYPQLQGLSLEQGDITQFNGMATETKAYYAKHGRMTLWTNSMFSGMPTYQIGGIQNTNVYRYIEKFSTLGLSRPIGYFVFGTLAAYLMFLVMGLGTWVSIIGGLVFAFSTTNVILFDVGHNTKLFTILGAPIIMAGLMLILEKRRYIPGVLALSIGIGFNVYKNHYQITYYLAIFLGIYTLIALIKMIRSKDYTHLKHATLAILGSCVLGVGPSSTKLITTFEYAQESIRGKQLLSRSNVWTSQDSSLHTQWDYNMQFSHDWRDIKSFIVPAAVGGSSAEFIRENSAISEAYDEFGYVWEDNRANLYWGGLPFSGGPPYLGISLLFLAMMGFLTTKTTFRWWILGSLLLATALSLGKNFEFFNRLFFDYFPFYKAFRSPNSIMQAAVLFAPLLAFPFLAKLFREKIPADINKLTLICSGVLALLLVLILLSAPDASTVTRDSDLTFANRGMDPGVLITERMAYMRDDALRSLLFLVVVAGLVLGFVRYRFNPQFLLIAVGAVVLFDFLGVNRRYINPSMFQQKKEIERIAQPRPVDRQIMEDPDPHFRVIDQTVNTFASSMPSYFHKSVGGYHAAKLRRYEDLIELHIRERNEKVINMLNAKYFILRGENGQPVVAGNRDILGNAWFIENFRWVSSADDEINALNYFDPRTDAVVHEEFREYLEGCSPARQGAIDLVSYEPNHLIYESEGTGERFAVFSEIWYGPNKGWKVYIDGERHDHIRVNYVLRGLRIPEGDHRIEFIFDPDLYTIGQYISTFFSLSFLGLVGFLGYNRWEDRGARPGRPSPKRKKKSSSKTKRSKRKDKA